jgi:hypothetical protein
MINGGAQILAAGGFSANPSGGGSGGGIFLHAASVSLAGSDVLDVSGGHGGPGTGLAGGGGGGGRILILASSYSPPDPSVFNLAGGAGGGFDAGNGGTGVLIVSFFPGGHHSVFGQAVTFTATVSVNSPGAGTPTGTVLFEDGGIVIGSGTLGAGGVPGQESFSTSSLSVGAHSITAVYTGDTNDQSSTSGTLTQTVDQDSTTTTLSSSASPSVFGQAVTFTATVAVLSPGAGTPTGTVTFLDGATTLGTGTLAVVNGQDQATFSTRSLSVATHSITAVYTGDTNDVGGTSNTVTQTVNQDNTTTSLVASASPSTYGDSVTFTAVVTAQGNPVTSGTVDFMEGDTVLASMVPLSASGTASFSISSLSAITHTITAYYSGASALDASSGSVQQIVNKKAASVTANAATKVYGSADPVLTGSTSGFLAADGVTASFSRAAGEIVAGGPYTIGATLGPAGVLGNYAITYYTANFTITARPITVSADAQTKVYGAADPALTYRITSGNLVNGDGFIGAPTRAAGEGVGGYPIGQGTLSAGTNYNLTYVGNALTITPATPKITWSNPADITYGTALSSAQLNATASVPGTFTYTPVAGTILGVGSNQLFSVSFTPADPTDYTTASATAHINVLMAQPSFSQLTPSQSISFGQTTNVSGKLATTSAIPPGGQVSISIGSASVTATISPGGSFSATIDTRTLGVLSTPYTITYTYAGDANFQSASDASTTLTVNRATPTLNWPNPADIAYGTALSSTQLAATASIAGSFTYTPAAGTVLKAGAGQTLSVSFTPTDRTDYATVTSTATISVTRATPVLTVGATSGTYDGTPFPATFAIASGIPGLNNTPAASLEEITPALTYYEGAGTSGAGLGPTPPTAAGTYTVVARFPGSTDYAPTQSTPVVFTIDRGVAAIAVAVSPGSAVYGQSLTFVATVAGASVPSGTVTFFDGATSLATVPLDGSGKATLTTSGLAIGSHAITATYSGDADFFGSQSGSTTESVSQAATEIVLVPHPVLRRKKVVSLGLTAEVVPVLPGGGVPTGMVTFEFLVKHGKKLKVKTLGIAALNGAEATLTVKPRAVLNRPITIIYSGDPDYRGSTLTPPKLTRTGLKSLARPTVTSR